MIYMKKALFFAAPLALLSGCVSSGSAPIARPKLDAPAGISAPKPISSRGLEAVMGKDSVALKRLFGEPRLDIVEVNGRKMQFLGKACVLDAYLYASGKNGPEVVTHVDARRSDGAEVDRASCVNALQSR
jgi:hypothetical protein